MFGRKQKPDWTSVQIAPVALSCGLQVPINIRQSQKASRLAIRLRGSDGIELVVPEAASVWTATQFFENYRAWATLRLEQSPRKIPFTDGNRVPVLGVERILRSVGRGGKGRSSFLVTGDAIEVTGDSSFIARRVETGLRRLAKEIVAAKTATATAKLDRRAGRITIGDPSSRWGSCSAKGDLRFSWRLVMAPETIIDYVVAHEVAHLEQMNHSPRFWAVVKYLHPDFQRDRAWLKSQGATLFRYGD